jgi:hypothetical protein
MAIMQRAAHSIFAVQIARGVAVIFTMALSAPPILAATLAEVTDCMRANVPETVRAQEVQFSTIDRGRSQRVLTGRIVASRAEGLMRANLRLESPPDLKGAAYLSRETHDGRDEMYVYLPALNRVRRVVGGGRNNALFGTDFSYNDLRQIHDAFSGGQVTLLGEAELEAQPVYHLEVMRSQEEDGPERMQAWVDRKACVALQIDMFAGASVIKRISSPPDSLKQLPAGQWYAERVRVEDRLAESSTDMTVEEVEVGEDMPERLFNPRSFYLGL